MSDQLSKTRAQQLGFFIFGVCFGGLSLGVSGVIRFRDQGLRI